MLCVFASVGTFPTVCVRACKKQWILQSGWKKKSADTVGHPGTQTHGGTTWGQNGILILNNPHYTYIIPHV